MGNVGGGISHLVLFCFRRKHTDKSLSCWLRAHPNHAGYQQEVFRALLLESCAHGHGGSQVLQAARDHVVAKR